MTVGFSGTSGVAQNSLKDTSTSISVFSGASVLCQYCWHILEWGRLTSSGLLATSFAYFS